MQGKYVREVLKCVDSGNPSSEGLIRPCARCREQRIAARRARIQEKARLAKQSGETTGGYLCAGG
jgi:hypothetical protein